MPSAVETADKPALSTADPHSPCSWGECKSVWLAAGLLPVRRPEYIGRVSWQARMIAQGISAGQLDALLRYSNQDLYQRGYFWSYTVNYHPAKTPGGL